MASFGTMSAMLSCGARIAAERSAGWTRQLRISPLSPRAYFRAKVLTAYMMALITLVVLYAAGISLGVSLRASRWLEMTGLMLVGLIPFAALGILLGHMFTPDSIGPAMGGGVALLALLGRHLLPARQPRLPARTGAVPAILLAGAGEPRGDRRACVVGQGLDRDGRLDACAEPPGGARVPARHRAGVAAIWQRHASRATLGY